METTALLSRLAFARHNLVDFDLATLFYSPADRYCKPLILLNSEGKHSWLKKEFKLAYFDDFQLFIFKKCN